MILVLENFSESWKIEWDFFLEKKIHGSKILPVLRWILSCQCQKQNRKTYETSKLVKTQMALRGFTRICLPRPYGGKSKFLTHFCDFPVT